MNTNELREELDGFKFWLYELDEGELLAGRENILNFVNDILSLALAKRDEEIAESALPIRGLKNDGKLLGIYVNLPSDVDEVMVIPALLNNKEI